MELGASALTFLISTWEYHLTPPEAASVADKASKCRDAAMVRAGKLVHDHFEAHDSSSSIWVILHVPLDCF